MSHQYLHCQDNKKNTAVISTHRLQIEATAAPACWVGEPSLPPYYHLAEPVKQLSSTIFEVVRTGDLLHAQIDLTVKKKL